MGIFYIDMEILEDNEIDNKLKRDFIIQTIMQILGKNYDEEFVTECLIKNKYAKKLSAIGDAIEKEIKKINDPSLIYCANLENNMLVLYTLSS